MFLTLRSDAYQSEAELEKEFIRLLTDQGYKYLAIHNESDLAANMRVRLEKLNGFQFTNGEWERFFKGAPIAIALPLSYSASSRARSSMFPFTDNTPCLVLFYSMRLEYRVL